MQCHDLLRTAMHIARTTVVAKAAPQSEHIIGLRRRQMAYGRKPLQEPGVVLQHRAYLGLLQHDFR